MPAVETYRIPTGDTRLAYYGANLLDRRDAVY